MHRSAVQDEHGRMIDVTADGRTGTRPAHLACTQQRSYAVATGTRDIVQRLDGEFHKQWACHLESSSTRIDGRADSTVNVYRARFQIDNVVIHNCR